MAVTIPDIPAPTQTTRSGSFSSIERSWMTALLLATMMSREVDILE